MGEVIDLDRVRAQRELMEYLEGVFNQEDPLPDFRDLYKLSPVEPKKYND